MQSLNGGLQKTEALMEEAMAIAKDTRDEMRTEIQQLKLELAEIKGRPVGGGESNAI